MYRYYKLQGVIFKILIDLTKELRFVNIFECSIEIYSCSYGASQYRNFSESGMAIVRKWCGIALPLWQAVSQLQYLPEFTIFHEM